METTNPEQYLTCLSRGEIFFLSTKSEKIANLTIMGCPDPNKKKKVCVFLSSKKKAKTYSETHVFAKGAGFVEFWSILF